MFRLTKNIVVEPLNRPVDAGPQARDDLTVLQFNGKSILKT